MPFISRWTESGGKAIAVPWDEMERRLCLFYTGAPRQSGINNWEVFKQHINGDQRVIQNFSEISRIAQGDASRTG